MEFLSNLLLTAASLGAALYCLVLSRRLKALASLEGGMGSAIAVLSAQVDEMGRTLKAAQEAAARSGGRLDAQTARAEAAARKLELLVASLHDLPEEPAPMPVAERLAAAPGGRSPSGWPADAGRRGPERAMERAPAPVFAGDRDHDSGPGNRGAGWANGRSVAPPVFAAPLDDSPETAPRARVLRRRQGPEAS